MKTISILVADDHEVVRRGLCSLLQTQPAWNIVEAADGNEAVSKAIALHPDLVIMDINMPYLNGLEATRQIHEQIPNLPVVLLSAYSADELVDRAMQANISGYVYKTDAAKDLISAVQAVLEGRRYFTPDVSRHLPGNDRRPSARETTTLTVREVEIVRLLCKGKSNKEVAGHLGLSPRTIEAHRAHIMEKLHLHSFSELMRYAIRNAIIQP